MACRRPCSRRGPALSRRSPRCRWPGRNRPLMPAPCSATRSGDAPERGLSLRAARATVNAAPQGGASVPSGAPTEASRGVAAGGGQRAARDQGRHRCEMENMERGAARRRYPAAVRLTRPMPALLPSFGSRPRGAAMATATTLKRRRPARRHARAGAGWRWPPCSPLWWAAGSRLACAASASRSRNSSLRKDRACPSTPRPLPRPHRRSSVGSAAHRWSPLVSSPTDRPGRARGVSASRRRPHRQRRPRAVASGAGSPTTPTSAAAGRARRGPSRRSC
jgi:hypothetical protein